MLAYRRTLTLVDVINLKKECSSSNLQVAALSGAMLKLQGSVIQQFHLYRLSSGAFSPVQEEPVRCIDPWMLREGEDRHATRSSGTGQSQFAPREQELPKRRSSIAITSSYPRLGSNDVVETLCDHHERARFPKRKKSPSFPKISSILETLLDHVRHKIIKAKWSKDLHEFGSDQMLPVAEFEAIRKDLDHRRAELGTRYVRYLACVAERPCWAIVRPRPSVPPALLTGPLWYCIDGVGALYGLWGDGWG